VLEEKEMKRLLLAVAAALALLVGPAFTNSADAQYRYYSYRPYYGGYNNYYSPYYGNSYYGNSYYGGNYYRPYSSGYRGYYGGGYGGYGGGYGGWGGYNQPGVYIGGRGIGVGFGF
jgi:hypothetical protein